MSTIRVEDLAYIRFRAPDLDVMESFLLDFGFVVASRTEETLHVRGTGTAPFAHVTVRGEAGFDGLAFRAASVEDLHVLAEAEGAAVEPNTAIGGGFVVKLRDPDGFAIEVVAGQALSPPLPLAAREATNDARQSPRTNEPKRIASGPSQVRRLGHCVLNVTDFRASEKWYKDRFGLLTSDEIYVGDPSMVIGAFTRCDRGEVPTDHHTLFLLGTGAPKFNHVAFEVTDMDDLMAGNAHLLAKGRDHEWGVGRHFLGSQIFDYWRDPWGNTVEHWTDGDLFAASWGSRQAPLETLIGVQWGPAMPPTMG